MGFIRQATTGTIISVAAIVLFALASFNTPLIKQLYFFKIKSNIERFNAKITFGTLGYCISIEEKRTCIDPTLGYKISLDDVGLGEFKQLPEVQDFMNEIPNEVLNWVTYVFVLHFISLGFSFFSVLIGIFSHLREVGRSYWSIFISVFACVVSLVTFAFDIAFAVIAQKRFYDSDVTESEIGQSVWLVLAGAIILLLSTILFCFGVCLSRRQHKSKDLFDTEKHRNTHLIGKNQENSIRMSDRRKATPNGDDESFASVSPLPGSLSSDKQPLVASNGRTVYDTNDWSDTKSTAQTVGQPYGSNQNMYQNNGAPYLGPSRPTSPFEQQIMRQSMVAPYLHPQQSMPNIQFARSPPPPPIPFSKSPPPIPFSKSPGPTLPFAQPTSPNIPYSASPGPVPYINSPPPSLPFTAPQMPMYFNQNGNNGVVQNTGTSYNPSPDNTTYWQPSNYNQDMISRVSTPANTGQFQVTNNVAQQAAAEALSVYSSPKTDVKQKPSETSEDALPSAPASSPPVQTAAPTVAKRQQKSRQWTAPLVASPPPPPQSVTIATENDPYLSAGAIPGATSTIRGMEPDFSTERPSRRIDDELSKDPPPYTNYDNQKNNNTK